MPFDIQPIHIVIIAIVALLIFGPQQLPEIGRKVGRALGEFRRGASEMTSTFREEVNRPPQNMTASGTAPTQPGPASAFAGSATLAGSIDPRQAGRFCIQCGSPNLPEANFCQSCGIKLPERNTSAPQPVPPGIA
jgi:TatA/E family protein of Tat protein translocase